MLTVASGLTRAGVEGGAVPVLFVPDDSFTAELMAGVIINAINFSDSAAVARLRAGSTIFLSEADAVGGALSTIAATGDLDGKLDGIKDLARNDLRPNRPNNETQFTILLPGAALDFGDAPDPLDTFDGKYPTLQRHDGARHVIVPDSVFLGSVATDAEADGQPFVDALGDDFIDPFGGRRDDEDGVTSLTQTITPRNILVVLNQYVDAPLTVTASGAGLLDAWIDWNRDGDWEDFGEKVFDSIALLDGANDLTIRAPSFAQPGHTYARFRYSIGGALFPTGISVGGEVEDYLVTVVTGTPPVAVDDAYSTNEDTKLDVLAANGLIFNPSGRDTDTEGEPLTVYEVNGVRATWVRNSRSGPGPSSK